MDFINDTPTSPYGLALLKLGLNTSHIWDRKRGLLAVGTRVDQHTYTYLDPSGYANATWWDMPGDVRDFGEGY
jgi:hypothetical protein